MSKVLFVGGGSIGHIAPNIAIWQEYQKLDPAAECLFVCANRIDDTKFLESYHLPHATISSPRLTLNFPITFLKALLQSIKILWQLTPDVVMSKGGYISVPICLIASLMGVPIILHESDAISGRANRFVALWAKKTCYGFARSKLSNNAVVTGNPIRDTITKGNRERGLERTRLSGTKPILLVMGGSQGSKAINEAIWQNLPALLTLCNIVHITGRGKNTHKPLVHITTTSEYYVQEFVTDELADLYAISSFALTRASASTITELTANSIPMILCPLRGVGHDHQKVNATTIEATGTALQIEQTELPQTIVSVITKLVSTPLYLQEMQQKMQSKEHVQAASTIAQILWQEKLDAKSN